MFQQAASAFAPHMRAIQDHLRGIENELERAGRKAGSKAANGMTQVSEQLTDTIASTLNDMTERFQRGRRIAQDEAARFGTEAARLGADYGTSAVRRISSEVEHRPLAALAVAVGVGILIGLASRSSR
jgi:ElaB/YqjD/DUF883 family membrane-anchored ribosome-binding protein